MSAPNPPVPPQKPEPTAGAQPVPVACPHCGTQVQVHPQNAYDVITCLSCGNTFQATMPPPHPGSYPAGYGHLPPISQGVKIPVLISAIFNIIFGLFWISTICGIVIGIPQIILAVFEFIFFAQADTRPRNAAMANAKTLGVMEILSGLFNGVSLVCGVLVLVFASQEPQQP